MATNPNYPTAANGRIVGEEVVYGAPKISLGATGATGVIICQSCTKTQAGELKEYNDEAGDTAVIVLKGDHREFSFDGLIDKNLPDQKQGTLLNIVLTLPDGTSATYKPRMQTWQRSYGNEDVAKVSVTARTYPAIDGGTACDPEYSAATANSGS